MRRKGTIIDFLFIVIAMAFFAIALVFSIYIFDQISPMLTGFFGAGEATTMMNTVHSAYGIMDYVFLFLFFGLSIVPIVFAFLVKTHPIFFVVNLIMIVVMFMVMPALSNMVRSIWATPELAQYAAGGGGSFTFTIMTRTFQFLPLITCSLSILLSIAMFAKGREI